MRLACHDEIVKTDQMEAVWHERAKRLARRPVLAEAGHETFPVMVVGIGKERYGIDFSDVAEVLPPVRPTPVPGAAAVFAGVINVHGEIRPVVDLRRLLGIQAETDRDVPLARVILLRRNGHEMGLQIDTVEHIRWIASADLQTGGAGDTPTSVHLRGSTKDLLLLLRTEALFAVLQSVEPHAGDTT
jgi:chemotaxis signal transduction protein